MNGPESERECPAQPRAAYYEKTLTSTALESWADEVTVPVARGAPQPPWTPQLRGHRSSG